MRISDSGQRKPGTCGRRRRRGITPIRPGTSRNISPSCAPCWGERGGLPGTGVPGHGRAADTGCRHGELPGGDGGAGSPDAGDRGLPDRRHRHLDDRPQHPAGPRGSPPAGVGGRRQSPAAGLRGDARGGHGPSRPHPGTGQPLFEHYAALPSYRAILEREGVEGPGDIAIVGSEAAVEDQLRHLAELGATDLLATIFPVDGSPDVGHQDPGAAAEPGRQDLTHQVQGALHFNPPGAGPSGARRSL